jgi:C4-dicarboxylate-specific signal transduction histidine kinase
MRRFVRKGGNQYCELDVNQPATAVASLLEYEAKARQVALTLDLCEPLPPVWADRILIEQVIYNLVRNAIETLAAREQDRRVTLRTHADTEYVWLEVTDNGPGIDQEIGEHIFEAFSTQKQDGLGMGLAISRSIIGSLGGNLGYNNLQEGGVMFYFNLPLENP